MRTSYLFKKNNIHSVTKIVWKIMTGTVVKKKKKKRKKTKKSSFHSSIHPFFEYYTLLVWLIRFFLQLNNCTLQALFHPHVHEGWNVSVIKFEISFSIRNFWTDINFSRIFVIYFVIFHSSEKTFLFFTEYVIRIYMKT